MMKKLLRNESGYSIVLVFFIMIIVSVLSLALLKMSTQSLSLSTHEREDQSIFYIAESGLTYEKEPINDLINAAYITTRAEFKQDLLNENRQENDYYRSLYTEEIHKAILSRYTEAEVFSDFKSQYPNQPKAEIIATIDIKDPLTINMSSTGYFAENASNTRTVSQSITVNMDLKFLNNIEDEGSSGDDVNLPNLAVQAKGDITLGGSATIHGSTATFEGKVIFDPSGDGNIKGAIGSKYAPIGPDWLIQQKKIMERHVIPNLTEINLPPFPTDKMNSLAALIPPEDIIKKDSHGNIINIINNGNYYGSGGNEITRNYYMKLTKDTKFNNFILDGGGTTNLDIGNNVVNLYTDNLNISEGYINITGSGKLNIFVKDSISIGGGSTIKNNGNPNNLTIYYAGNRGWNPVTLANHIFIEGSFFAKESNLHIDGSATISGNITTGGKNVIIDGGSNNLGKYIIAPDAHVQFNQNFSGVIICDTFTASGNSQIKYAPSIVPPPFLPDIQPDYSDPTEDLFEEKDLIEI